MPLNLAAIRRDYSFIIGDLSTVFTFGSRTYNGRKTTVSELRDMMEEGLQVSYSFSLYCLESDFPTAPVVDQELTIGSTTYLIIGIDTDNTGQLLRLDLAEETAE